MEIRFDRWNAFGRGDSERLREKEPAPVSKQKGKIDKHEIRNYPN